jgi:hypothetical protein
MRMWMCNPKILCRKHLLGEHGEIHKHRHNFMKHHSIHKRIVLGQIEPRSMVHRHDELVIEMIKRGYNHHSPYQQPDISYLPKHEQEFKVDVNKSIKDLINRCPECKRQYIKLKECYNEQTRS